MKKKVKIKYGKERVLLSDVLPFETPPIFSNRHFYNYVSKRNKAMRSKSFKHEDLKAFKEISKILFDKSDSIKKPFTFGIKHKKKSFRNLTIIHPSDQVRVVNFYDSYKSMILYYCSISQFSIRKPVKVASHLYYNDMLHKINTNGGLTHSQIEQDDEEYESLKSFFSYRRYSNIHRFYESYLFHRSEKKFSKLRKLDISKCFDSIYTHSITWALLNKSIVKENIESSRSTFGGTFDVLMQKINANETNGIIIGPEFSRIFSEIVLQRVDENVRLKIKDASSNMKHKRDYEIFRYVDDYFSNAQQIKTNIKN